MQRLGKQAVFLSAKKPSLTFRETETTTFTHFLADKKTGMTTAMPANNI
jgi:hypothetical protein